MKNYRLLAHKGRFQTVIKLHGVSYSKKGIATTYTANPITLSGEDLQEIEEKARMLNIALERPILYADRKFPKEYKTP